jgi:hypothetical protein
MLIFSHCRQNVPQHVLTHSNADDAGARTVNGRTSTSQTIRATVAVTVTASGELLEPLIVFKGKPGGRIESREFATYPPGAVYACQDAAWMDERVILKWVETVLKPYVENVPDNIQPLLLLDSSRCHTMASVAAETADLGVEVKIIPGRRLHSNVSAH